MTFDEHGSWCGIARCFSLGIYLTIESEYYFPNTISVLIHPLKHCMPINKRLVTDTARKMHNYGNNNLLVAEDFTLDWVSTSLWSPESWDLRSHGLLCAQAELAVEVVGGAAVVLIATVFVIAMARGMDGWNWQFHRCAGCFARSPKYGQPNLLFTQATTAPRHQ